MLGSRVRSLAAPDISNVIEKVPLGGITSTSEVVAVLEIVVRDGSLVATTGVKTVVVGVSADIASRDPMNRRTCSLGEMMRHMQVSREERLRPLA